MPFPASARIHSGELMTRSTPLHDRHTALGASFTDFGGWSKAQPEHFGDGGIFDQIYVPK